MLIKRAKDKKNKNWKPWKYTRGSCRSKDMKGLKSQNQNQKYNQLSECYNYTKEVQDFEKTFWYIDGNGNRKHHDEIVF